MADTSFVDQSGTTQGTTVFAAWLNAINKWGFWGRRPNYATTTGAANAQILTLETGSLYAAGSEADGDEFIAKAGFTNTGAMTLQIIPPSGTNTARAVQYNGAALVGGEVQSGNLYKWTRLGTTWQVSRTDQIKFSGPTAQRIVTFPDTNLTLAAITAKGSSWWASAANTLAELVVGSNTQVPVADSTQAAGVRWADPWSRGMLAGNQLTWVSGTSLTMGAGTCRDDADTETMKLTSALTMSNLTVGWVVGNNQPKIRTGVTLSNGMTLHAYIIKRVDTGVVDWFLSDEASNPTLPTSYTKSRRVLSIPFGTGTQTFPQIIQDGDYFRWSTSVLDIAVTNPGTSAVLRTLSLPTGINVQAHLNAFVFDSTPTGIAALLSDPAAADIAPAQGGASLANLRGTAAGDLIYGQLRIRTNTSAQIRSRLSGSGANTSLSIATMGWDDTRGRFA